MSEKIKKAKAYTIDFVNAFRYRGATAQILDKCAREGKSKDETVAILTAHYALFSRASWQTSNRYAGWAVFLASGLIGFVPTTVVGFWKAVESYERIPLTKHKNPFMSIALDPSQDKARAYKVVRDHYGKRFTPRG